LVHHGNEKSPFFLLRQPPPYSLSGYIFPFLPAPRRLTGRKRFFSRFPVTETPPPFPSHTRSPLFLSKPKNAVSLEGIYMWHLPSPLFFFSDKRPPYPFLETCPLFPFGEKNREVSCCIRGPPPPPFSQGPASFLHFSFI